MNINNNIIKIPTKFIIGNSLNSELNINLSHITTFCFFDITLPPNVTVIIDENNFYNGRKTESALKSRCVLELVSGTTIHIGMGEMMGDIEKINAYKNELIMEVRWIRELKDRERKHRYAEKFDKDVILKEKVLHL